MGNWSLFVLLLVVTCSIAAGVVGAVVNTWKLRSTVLDLQDRLALLEGAHIREVKSRAGQERWKKPDQNLQILEAMKTAPTGRTPNWWEKTATK